MFVQCRQLAVAWPTEATLMLLNNRQGQSIRQIGPFFIVVFNCWLVPKKCVLCAYAVPICPFHFGLNTAIDFYMLGKSTVKRKLSPQGREENV